MKRISTIVAIVLALPPIIVLPLRVDNYFAKAEEVRVVQAQVKAVEKRLDQQLDFARRKSLDDRNWALEKRYDTRDPLKMPEDIQDEYKRNIGEIKEIDDKWELK